MCVRCRVLFIFLDLQYRFHLKPKTYMAHPNPNSDPAVMMHRDIPTGGSGIMRVSVKYFR